MTLSAASYRLEPVSMSSLNRNMLIRPVLLAVACTLLALPVATNAQAYLPPAELAQRLGMDYTLEPSTGRLLLHRSDQTVIVLAPGIKRALVAESFVDLPEPGISTYAGSFVTPQSVADALAKLVPKPAAPKPGNWKVVVDAGHGGKDPGAIGPRGTQEKDTNLAIALKLRAALQGEGIEVVMTRATDVFVPLEERAEVCRRESPDAFVSIHANAAKSSSARGIETYYITHEIDDVARAANASLTPEGAEKFMGTSAAPSGAARQMLYAVLYEELRRESRLLATHIQDSLSDSLSASPDRGVRQANLHVLRGSISPAALVETEFLSNPSNEKLLSSSPFQEKVARAIAAGIVQYLSRQ